MGDVCNFFKMFGVFGSSITSSLSDVCQCNLAPFCETSNHLSIPLHPNIICQCHMKAQCVFQEYEGAKMGVLVVVQYHRVCR